VSAYTWAFLGRARPRAGPTKAWWEKSWLRPDPTVVSKILAQARPIIEKARRALGRTASLNRAKSRSRPSPAIGQKIRPSPEAWSGQARPGNFGPGQVGLSGPGCPWPGPAPGSKTFCKAIDQARPSSTARGAGRSTIGRYCLRAPHISLISLLSWFTSRFLL
jgi:hypothetical protein